MNEITFCIGAEQYREAFAFVDQLVEFQRQQKKMENRIFTFLFKAAIHVHAYPQYKCTDPSVIQKQLDTLIRSFKRGDSNSFYGEYFWIYAAFLHLNNQREKAIKILQAKECRSFFSEENFELMKNGQSLPRPPEPPSLFNIASGGDKIYLN